MDEIVHKTIEATKKATIETQMQVATISISFPLKGHTVTVIGMNPDLIYKIIAEIKKNHALLSPIGKMKKEGMF